MSTAPNVRWSSEVAAADWIRERLSPFGSDVVTSIVPSGFQAYARLLHPVDEPFRSDGRLVRWADVAAWSGLPLRPGAQFHDIALPRGHPPLPAPGAGNGPREGTLHGPDAAALAETLAAHTTTPDDCYFCLWDGYGWDSRALLRAYVDGGYDDVPTAADPTEPPSGPAEASDPVDPVPPAVRAGPRVALPHRDYLLYRGDVMGALAFVESEQQTANLWWPADHAWCVASEIDLPWTYVGGARDAIDAVLVDTRLEAQPAGPDDGHQLRLDGYVADLADQVTEALLATGEAELDTARGALTARLRRPGRWRSGAVCLEYRAHHGGTSGSSSGRLVRESRRDLRAEVERRVFRAIAEDLARI